MALLRPIVMETEAASSAKAGAAEAKAAAAKAGATKAVAATDGATEAKAYEAWVADCPIELLEDLPSEAKASKSVATCIADKVWSLDAQPANSACFQTQVAAVRGATQSRPKSNIKVKNASDET